jgi:hypothetical protein
MDKLSGKWSRLLDRMGISDFHMADLPESDRDKVVLKAAPVIREHVRCILALGVSVTDFNNTRESRKVLGTAYQYCCFHCLRMATDWAKKSPKREPIAFFFDRDGKFTTQTTELYHSVVTRFVDLKEKHKIGNLAFGDRRHLVPLQMADALAWEMRRYRRERLVNPNHRMNARARALIRDFKRQERLDQFDGRQNIEESVATLSRILMQPVPDSPESA